MKPTTVRVSDLLRFVQETGGCRASIEWLERLDPEWSAYRAWQKCPYWFWLRWLVHETAADRFVTHFEVINMVEELGGQVDGIDPYAGDQNIGLDELMSLETPPRVWATAYRSLIPWRHVRDVLMKWMVEEER
jgi:hypothetical protein